VHGAQCTGLHAGPSLWGQTNPVWRRERGLLEAMYSGPLQPCYASVVYTHDVSVIYTGNRLYPMTYFSGSPFPFNVLDPGKVMVRGSGWELVPVNELTSFTITAPSAKIQDIDVVITG